MKLTPRKREETSSATITQTLGVMVACSVLCALTAYASPAWWSSPGTGSQSAVVAPQVTTNDGVVTTNYVPNDYAAVTQGQVKQFTARAVDDLNAGLTNYGGAGTNLNSMVSNWASDYATNGYNATNIKPSDYTAMNVGQLKYIGNLVWSQLRAAGYTNAAPSWLHVTSTTDPQLANIGQLKTVFDFDISAFPYVPHLTSSTTASGNVGSVFTSTITANNSPTSYGVTGLLPGLSVNTSTGMISGIPTAAGTYLLVLSLNNGYGTSYSMLAVTINPAIPVITSGTTTSALVGVPFDYTITANNSPTSFSATGLPSGLGVDTSTGVIFGTPTGTATSTVTLGAINAGGTGTTTLTLTVNDPSVPVITSGTTVTGVESTPFSYTITASNSPTSFSASGLPTGLSINTSTGLISGTVTTTGASTVTLGAINAGGTGTTTLALMINNTSAPVITGSLSVAWTGSFSYSIAASNTPTSYGATGLPSGLSLNSSTGVISGTLGTGTSIVSAIISATNGSGTGSATLMLIPAPVISSTTTASGNVGSAFSYTIAASNSPTSYSASGLPAGLGVNAGTGVISGTPATTGTSMVTVGATNVGGTGTGTMTLTINIPSPAPVINSGTSASGDAGAPFSYTITTATTNNVVSFSASGLPSGLSVDASTGVISGTPTTSGTETVTLGASNVWGTGNEMLSLTINSAGAPVISSATTANGTMGSAFSYTITASNSPTSFNATGLPVGLSINTSTGAITGTPIATGVSTVTLDAANTTGTATATLALTINPPAPAISSATSESGAFGVAISPYTITASNSPTSFSATGLPPGLTFDAFTGSITGTPTASGTISTTIGATNAGGTGTTTLTFSISGLTSSPILNNSLADGALHSLMLKTDGTVWAAGDNTYDELGSDPTFFPMSPSYLNVSGLSSIVAVGASGVSSLALKSDGTVWSWGVDTYGQLGNGTSGSGTTTADSYTPVQVLTSTGTLTGVTAVTGGLFFNMALTSDGKVWTWGSNSYDVLGIGIDIYTSGEIDFATQVSTTTGLTDAVAIAGGTQHALALDSNGTVWAWGDDSYDEFGDTETNSESDVPVQVPGISGITAIAAGDNYSLALSSDGTVWAWGDNTYGELGTGTAVVNTDDPSYTGPVKVPNLTGIVAIRAQGDCALALKSDGTVWVWGDNTYGQLGNGTTGGDTTSTGPVQVPNLTGVIVISAGYNHNTVLKSDGSVWGWGDIWDSSVPIELGNRQAISPPIITPAAGGYSSSQTVSISTTLTGTIHYTLDGTEPTFTSPSYTGSFLLSGSALVSAGVFTGTGVLSSPIASSQYYIPASDTGLPTLATALSGTIASSSQVDLSWTLSGLVNYSAVDIYRSSDGGSTYLLIATLSPSATSFYDTNVQVGNTYQYMVGTYNTLGESETSAVSSGTVTSTGTLTINVTTPSGATPLP